MQNLPEANTPLVLADGTKIDPSTGRPVKVASSFVEVPNGRRAQEIVARTRKRAVDLPEPPKTMNAVSVVLCYTMFGLAVQEVAIATGLTIEQVETIRKLEAYNELEAAIVDTVLESDSENVRAMLAQASHNAAHRITSLIDSDDETIQLAAAKDVLSRTGHTTR